MIALNVMLVLNWWCFLCGDANGNIGCYIGGDIGGDVCDDIGGDMCLQWYYNDICEDIGCDDIFA